MSDVPADARAPRPGVFVVSTGRCGSTMLSNMLRLNPEVLSLSEFLVLLIPDPLPPGELDRAVRLVEPQSPRWTALPEDQKSELARVCEPAMRRLYGGVRPASRRACGD